MPEGRAWIHRASPLAIVTVNEVLVLRVAARLSNPASLNMLATSRTIAAAWYSVRQKTTIVMRSTDQSAAAAFEDTTVLLPVRRGMTMSTHCTVVSALHPLCRMTATALASKQPG